MLNQAFFMGVEVVEKEIELGDGSKHMLHFRRVDSLRWKQYQVDIGSQDARRMAEAVHRLVMWSLCDAKGNPVLTWEQALSLKPEVLDAMWAAVQEVCRPSGAAKKKSQPEGKSGSGTPSRSPSAVDQ